MQYQNENTNGTYDFRCRSHNGFMVGSHIHEYSELLYCERDACDITVNGRKLCLYDNEFVFLPPNYIHRYDCVDATVICAVFSNDFIPLYFRKTNGKALVTDKLAAGKLGEIFKSLPTIEKSDSLLLSAYLHLICHEVIAHGEFESGQPLDGVLYQKIISYIASSFTQDISLEQIAKRFGYNKKYLSSALHTLTGIHFTDLIAIYRIGYAKELLTGERPLSVAEIATKCGFSSINTFNRKFKKLTSQTPSEYRTSAL